MRESGRAGRSLAASSGRPKKNGRLIAGRRVSQVRSD
jgi:hypothetical protein